MKDKRKHSPAIPTSKWRQGDSCKNKEKGTVNNVPIKKNIKEKQKTLACYFNFQITSRRFL